MVKLTGTRCQLFSTRRATEVECALCGCGQFAKVQLRTNTNTHRDTNTNTKKNRVVIANKEWIPINNNSERPVDALALILEKGESLTHSLTYNLKSRDASASKKDALHKVLQKITCGISSLAIIWGPRFSVEFEENIAGVVKLDCAHTSCFLGQTWAAGVGKIHLQHENTRFGALGVKGEEEMGGRWYL